jgi:hypothetical protein
VGDPEPAGVIIGGPTQRKGSDTLLLQPGSRSHRICGWRVTACGFAGCWHVSGTTVKHRDRGGPSLIIPPGGVIGWQQRARPVLAEQVVKLVRILKEQLGVFSELLQRAPHQRAASATVETRAQHAAAVEVHRYAWIA